MVRAKSRSALDEKPVLQATIIVCFRLRTLSLQHTLWPRGEKAKCLSHTSKRQSPRVRSSSKNSMVVLMLVGCSCSHSVVDEMDIIRLLIGRTVELSSVYFVNMVNLT